jgi:hypothetical protein
MGSTKHEKSFVDFEMPYEQNIIGLKGIVYFGVGLLLLIIVTFGLMWALLNVMEDDAEVEKKTDNPMAMSERERLPPEPRLQVAPGFGVESPDGRINLELREPQSEYNDLHKQWKEEWKNGIRDEKTGAVTAMPIEEAKQVFLQQNAKANNSPEAQKLAEESQLYITDSSSGRVSSSRRR